MSRSYRHTPRWGDRKSKIAKRWANRRVRRLTQEDILPRHAGYRKYFCSWIICDCQIIGVPFERFYRREVRLCRKLQKLLPSREEARKQYEKRYLRK